MNDYIVSIGDVHQKISKLKTILEREDVLAAKEVIFHGDYFDSFDDMHQMTDTVAFLNKNTANPRYTFLMGNHDISYLSTNKAYICSGYSQITKDYITKNLSKEFRNKIKLYELKKIGGKSVLFSHAGIHPSHFTFSTDATNHDSLIKFFDSLDIDINMSHPLLHAGRDRGGYQQYGGLLWIDWYSLELIEGLSQIVGHTQHTVPQSVGYSDMSTRNINIDTNLNHYLKIDLDTNDWNVVNLKK